MSNLPGIWPLYYPAVGDPLVPLENQFLLQAQSTRDALNGYSLPIAVGSSGQRDTLFPSPSQGDRVYRRDLGTEETYLAAYNSTTNPGGASPAGWYGRVEAARLVKSTGGTQSTGAADANTPVTWTSDAFNRGLWSSGANTRVTIRRPGLYMLRANLRFAGLGAGQYGILRFGKNGAWETVSENLTNPGASSVGGGYATSTDLMSCVPGDYIQVSAASSPGAQDITINYASLSVVRVGA